MEVIRWHEGYGQTHFRRWIGCTNGWFVQRIVLVRSWDCLIQVGHVFKQLEFQCAREEQEQLSLQDSQLGIVCKLQRFQ